MTIGRWTTAAILTAALVGCGGKVLVDGLPDGVGGHGQGQGGNGSTGGAGGGITCSNPPDPTTIMGCSTSATGGSGNFSCETDWCDGKNNIYAAKCSGTTCQCLLNGMVSCTCSINGGTACVNGVQDCCPWAPKPL